MNRDQTRALLALGAATSRDWAPTSTDVDAWAALLDDLDFDDCRNALLAHAKQTHHRPVPADIRAGVKRIRADRLERAPLAVPAADPDDVQAYLDDLRTDRHRNAGTHPGPQPKHLLSAFRDVPPASPAAIDAAVDLVRQIPRTPRPAPAAEPAPTTWPCCQHCTGTDDQVGHPPHRVPCQLCPDDTPTSGVLLDAQQQQVAP